MIKGILWDNDGVLVDTEHHFYAANREQFLEHGIDLSEADFFRWFLADNCGAWHLLSERGHSDAQIAVYRAARNVRYADRLRGHHDLAIPGMDSVLARCAARVPMGMVTSAQRSDVDIIHGRLDLMRHFRFVVAAEDYPNSKPAPDPYLLGLERLGLAGADCVAVEDSPRGLRAARGAGIECIVLRHRLMQGFAFDGAYRVVDSVAELQVELDALL